MSDLPPMVLGNGYSGAKMGNLPPMMLENGYSGAKVGDLPPMMMGGYRCVVFCWFYDTVVAAGYGRTSNGHKKWRFCAQSGGKMRNGHENVLFRARFGYCEPPTSECRGGDYLLKP